MNNRSFMWLVPVDVVIEGATGVALITIPAIVTRLLFGTDLPEIGAVLARIGGMILVLLVLSCWTGRRAHGGIATVAILLTYNALITLYFVFLGVQGEFDGVLLWPLTALHAIVAALFAVVLRGWNVQYPASVCDRRTSHS